MPKKPRNQGVANRKEARSQLNEVLQQSSPGNRSASDRVTQHGNPDLAEGDLERIEEALRNAAKDQPSEKAA